MNKFFEMVSDNSGGVSSIRVLMMAWGLVILIGWGYVSFKQGALSPIPETVLMALGGILSAKVTQRHLEKPEEPPIQ